ncbi:MAG: DUF86 domain-containing protein [Desulfovibrionaceae bacterium]|jgi:uncharacterized protein with HEPN domain
MDKQHRNVPALLDDIRSNAERALRFVEGMDWEQYAMDERGQYATARCLEIIGEAASHIPRDYQAQHPTIPWPAIIGMRNRLIHGYAGVDVLLCWNTIQNDLPHLLGEVEKLLTDYQ